MNSGGLTMTQPSDGTTPDGTRFDESTRAVPSQPTQPVPTAYRYPQPEAALDQPSASPSGVALSDLPDRLGGRRKGLLIGGLAAALVLAGVGAFAAQQLNGGGARPAEVMPSDTFAYVQVDIDPSAGQKVAAVRFLNKFPQVKDLESGDARKKLWDLAVTQSGDECLAKVSYDKDIQPWLGERAGFGLRPGGTKDKPNVALALQVTDEATATRSLSALLACDKGATKPEVRAKGGYVLLTEQGSGDDTLAALGRGSLAQNPTFDSDMTTLGEQGVASAWVDFPAAAKEVTALTGAPAASAVSPAKAHGSGALALRFDPSYVELAGFTHGLTAGTFSIPAGNGTELSTLPADTMAAFHLSGMGELLGAMWPELKKSIDGSTADQGVDDPVGQLEAQSGLSFPADLKTLLGTSITLALPDQKLGADAPTFGGKIVTGDATRADEILGTLEDLAGASGFLTRSVEGGKVYFASTPDYAEQLTKAGTLADNGAFKAALGDVSHSSEAIFVDLDKIEPAYLKDVPADSRAAVEAIRAVGLNVSLVSSNEARFSLRVVGN